VHHAQAEMLRFDRKEFCGLLENNGTSGCCQFRCGIGLDANQVGHLQAQMTARASFLHNVA